MRTFKHIAKLIKEKRLAHPNNYSQCDLSVLLGYKNGQFISNVERGLCNVPLKMLGRIAAVLDIDFADLKMAILRDEEETINAYFEKGNALTVTQDQSI